MRIFLDTEFIEDGHTIDLISIALVREDDVHFYAENKDCDLRRADSWVKEYVIPYLKGESYVMSKKDISTYIKGFVGPEPEFWADYGSYDWVVLRQLFGRMIDLPEGWPMYVNEFQQLISGRSDWKRELDKLNKKIVLTPHNALDDAILLKRNFVWVREKSREEMLRMW
jgi:hypothetical protein